MKYIQARGEKLCTIVDGCKSSVNAIRGLFSTQVWHCAATVHSSIIVLFYGVFHAVVSASLRAIFNQFELRVYRWQNVLFLSVNEKC